MSSASLTYLNNTTLVPNVLLSASSATKQGNTFNAANRLLQLDGSALVPNANIATSSVTKQGNSFNGTSQLVQTTSGGLLPALSAANLTSIPAGNLTGNFSLTNSTLTVLNTTTIVNAGTTAMVLTNGNVTRPNQVWVLATSTGGVDVTGMAQFTRRIGE